MEVSLAGLITIGITLVTALIGFVVWLIRLEAKISANEKNFIRFENEHQQLVKLFDDHRLNQDIHFQLRVSQQVEEKNKQRFETIESQLKQLDDKLEKKFETLNTKLEKLFDKK